MALKTAEQSAYDVAKKIEAKINEIIKARATLEINARKKATTLAEYEKRLAIVTLSVKNGRVTEWEGEKLNGPKLPANTLDRIVKGMCSRERLESDLAEMTYKSNSIVLQCLQAELNGLQSIYRHLSEI